MLSMHMVYGGDGEEIVEQVGVIWSPNPLLPKGAFQ